MKKNCCLCDCTYFVDSDRFEGFCPACLDRTEKIILSEGLIIPAPPNFTQAEPIFEKYFQKFGFAEFEKYIGCTVPDFTEAYENFKIFVEGYYVGFCGGHGYKYAPNEVRYPLIAEVCSYCEVDFFATLWKDYRVHYPAVNILAKEYFISPPGTRLEFLDCEEVMKRLLLVYWLNKEFFDEGKELSENPRKNPVPPEDMDKLSLEGFSFE